MKDALTKAVGALLVLLIIGNLLISLRTAEQDRDELQRSLTSLELQAYPESFSLSYVDLTNRTHTVICTDDDRNREYICVEVLL